MNTDTQLNSISIHVILYYLKTMGDGNMTERLNRKIWVMVRFGCYNPLLL